MNKNYETVITEDKTKKQIKVVRQFDAPVELVWKAWTDNNVLDKWWAPKPWKAETKSMDFKPGGKWLYAMVGPEGEKTWGSMDYETIIVPKSFTSIDSFSDENGVKNPDMPSTRWNAQFVPDGSGTRVEITLFFTADEEMDKLIETGFKEGFTMAQRNLDELLEKHAVQK